LKLAGGGQHDSFGNAIRSPAQRRNGDSKITIG